MNKDQFARLKRHRKVKQVLNDQANAVAAVPAFARLAGRYLTQLGLLDGTATRKPVTSEGATLAKSTAGTALIARLVKAANALYLLYKAEEPANLEEAAKMHRRNSDYVNMTDLELATEAIDLSKRVTANKEELMQDYNLDAAAIKALADDAKAFDDDLANPQLAIDAAKMKGATAKTTLSALNVFLRDDLRSGMELLKDSHPEAYAALREASQVDDARYGKGKKAGSTGNGPIISSVLLLLALASLLAGCSPNLARRYNNRSNNVKNDKRLYRWVPDSEVPTLANVNMYSYGVEEVPAATPADPTVLSLTGEGQAAFIKALDARIVAGTATAPALLAAINGEFDTGEQKLPEVKVIPKTLKKSLVFTVERPRFFGTGNTRKFNHPADRLAYLELAVDMPQDSWLRFNSWDRFVTKETTVDLGQITSAQEWNATLNGTVGSTAVVGVTTGDGSETSMPATEVRAIATNDEQAGAINKRTLSGGTSSNLTTGLGATASLSAANKLSTSQTLTNRILALSGTLRPKGISIVQEGAQGIDLGGNQSLAVQYTTTADWATPIWVNRLPAPSALYTAAGVPQPAAGLELKGFYILFPDVPHLAGADTLKGKLRYRFLYREVRSGNKHLPESRHWARYCLGEVGYGYSNDPKNKTTPAQQLIVRQGKSVALASANDYRPTTYRLRVSTTMGTTTVQRYLRLNTGASAVQFEKAKDALSFYQYIAALTRPLAAGATVPGLILEGEPAAGAPALPFTKADLPNLKLVPFEN